MEARSPRVPSQDPASNVFQSTSPAPQAQPAGNRHLHRERDFGVGYGNSSGYAAARRFTDGHVDPLFRFR